MTGSRNLIEEEQEKRRSCFNLFCDRATAGVREVPCRRPEVSTRRRGPDGLTVRSCRGSVVCPSLSAQRPVPRYRPDECPGPRDPPDPFRGTGCHDIRDRNKLFGIRLGNPAHVHPEDERVRVLVMDRGGCIRRSDGDRDPGKTPSRYARETPRTGSISAWARSRTIPPPCSIRSISSASGEVLTRPDILPPMPCTISGVVTITVPAPSQARTTASRLPVRIPELTVRMPRSRQSPRSR